MKNLKKALVLFLCAVLLVAGSVMGTLAYLTAQKSVVNTFTVGDVQIELDESNVATPDDTDRTREGNKYHLLPGETYVKDPTVTVLADSEDCYVRLKVTVNDVNKLKAAFEGVSYDGVHGKFDSYVNNGMFMLHLIVNGWEEETWSFKKYENGVYEFRYKTIVAKNSADQTLEPLFDSLTIPGAIKNDAMKNLQGVEINVTAEAIQATGFANADAAWEAFENA